MTEDIKIMKGINSKLGVLIALQMMEEKPETAREKISLLSDLGLDYNEISSILNVPAKYVSKERSLLKRKNGQKSI